MKRRLELTLTCEGDDLEDLIQALEETLEYVEDGFRAAHDVGPDSAYRFEIKEYQ